jgi:hypothetical protein
MKRKLLKPTQLDLKKFSKMLDPARRMFLKASRIPGIGRYANRIRRIEPGTSMERSAKWSLNSPLRTLSLERPAARKVNIAEMSKKAAYK